MGDKAKKSPRKTRKEGRKRRGAWKVCRKRRGHGKYGKKAEKEGGMESMERRQKKKD
ncbi:hypothetical protein L6R29_15385 [Myxococcota bacterium]|nr:hypothetical protein [Myxococcota bacterium]